MTTIPLTDFKAHLEDVVSEFAFENNIIKFEDRHTALSVPVYSKIITLHKAAENYAYAYEGNLGFMLSMKKTVLSSRHLTTGQARGTLNCLLHIARVASEQVADKTPARAGAIRPPNGIYTVVLEDSSHVTIRIKEPNWTEGKSVMYYLNGPDNEYSYTGYAFIEPDGAYHIWQKYLHAARLIAATETLVYFDHGEAGMRYAMESGNCYRCGRRLTVPTSLHRGLGKDCAEILGVA